MARLVFEIPLSFLVVCAWHRWFSTFPEAGWRFTALLVENPFFAVAVVLILLHELSIRYLRDQLAPESDYLRRLAMALPGTAIRLYADQYGNDSITRILRRIRFAAVVSGAIGLVLTNWG
jgi:hypothetical protein